jgi:hypothetical protein
MWFDATFQSIGEGDENRIGIVVVQEIMGGFWKLRSNNSWRKNVSFLMSVGLLLLFLCQLSLADVHHQRISGMVSTPLFSTQAFDFTIVGF